MPFLTSWLPLFSPDGNLLGSRVLTILGLTRKSMTAYRHFRHQARYAGGLKFSVIKVCTDTARPFME
jgi:hypothetical protein